MKNVKNYMNGLNYPIIDFTSSGLTHAYSGFTTEPNKYRVGEVVSQKSFGLLKVNFNTKSIQMEISERDYDLLVDTEIVVDVMLGSTNISISEFLKLGDGDIISLYKAAGSGGEIYVNSRIIGTGDIIVIDDKLAVRVQDSMDSDNVVRYFFDENLV